MGLAAVNAQSAGMWRMMPAANRPATSDSSPGLSASKAAGRSVASRRLKCRCRPLPTPSIAGFGVKLARRPWRLATSRTASRAITARSAAATPAMGAEANSNWPTPYSGSKVWTSTSAWSNAAMH